MMKQISLTLASITILLSLSRFVLAENYHLTIGETTIHLSNGSRKAMTINGTLPAPTLYFKEGEELIITVTNTLDEISSVHWHGLILPYTQDGAPGFSYKGIHPGETFTYRFPAKQAGTYWYHSHSNMQEQRGLYGAIIIEPQEGEPFHYDREYTVVLSDWHDTQAHRILSNLKRSPDYYNFNQETMLDLFDRKEGQSFWDTVSDRMDWGAMRMTKTDITDVSGYDFLINGMDPEQNWTALFKPGEKVRLRLINASAMSFMDIFIPDLRMTVVQADGNNVQPVTIDELRIAVGETYDVIVQPYEDRAYTLMAEPMGRTGYARGTLAPRKGMDADIPPTRPRPQLTMADMPMANMSGHTGSMHAGHASMGDRDMDHSTMGRTMGHEMMNGMDHSTMSVPKTDFQDAFYAPGSGLVPTAYNGGKFLSYSDLKAIRPLYAERPVDRDVTVRLTGNMERYIWSMNGETFDDAEPFRFREGERVRFTLINETMMTHPMHLHGMWMILNNGQGQHRPAKHVIQIAPAMTVTADVDIDTPGHWPFHCHLVYHMHAGMMRRIIVDPVDAVANNASSLSVHAIPAQQAIGTMP